VKKKKEAKGSLIIIGGREDKEEKMVILSEVARQVGKGKLCVATLASSIASDLWVIYRNVFRKLGVTHISHLDVVQRDDARDPACLRAVRGADAVFFTGGDQLRITSELGGSLVADEIAKIYEQGGLIAGTSAGASVMSESMLVGGPSDASYRGNSGVKMAPGLGFMKNVIIDQHFAERGRIGRLLGAISQNPKYLGIGIDEDTAIIVKGDEKLSVIGCGTVYVIDARGATESNISECDEDRALSIFNVKIHLLSQGDSFDIASRAPGHAKRQGAA
jgi:cyanophycinase